MPVYPNIWVEVISKKVYFTLSVADYTYKQTNCCPHATKNADIKSWDDFSSVMKSHCVLFKEINTIYGTVLLLYQRLYKSPECAMVRIDGLGINRGQVLYAKNKMANIGFNSHYLKYCMILYLVAHIIDYSIMG